MKLGLLILATSVALVSASPSPARTPPGSRVTATHAPAAQLEVGRTRSSLGTRFVTERQEVGGVPVLGAERVMTDAPGSKADLVIDHTYAGLSTPGPALVLQQAAIDAAARPMGFRAYRADPSASLAGLPRGSGVLVWRVLLPAASPLASFEVLVDAQNGKILRAQD